MKGVAPPVCPVILYGGVICLTGVGEMGEDHEDGADDD